jgi:hypothetical protein
MSSDEIHRQEVTVSDLPAELTDPFLEILPDSTETPTDELPMALKEIRTAPEPYVSRLRATSVARPRIAPSRPVQSATGGLSRAERARCPVIDHSQGPDLFALHPIDPDESPR